VHIFISLFDHLLESSHRDDSNKWSNIGFCEELPQVESVELHLSKVYTSFLELCKFTPFVCTQGNKYVPLEKFENVCVELNSALRREEQAQQLLQEQGRQLEELSTRMDVFSTEGMEKEQTLSEAIQVNRQH